MHTITIESEPFIGVKLHVTGTEGHFEATVHRSLKEVWLNQNQHDRFPGLIYQRKLTNMVYYVTLARNSPVIDQLKGLIYQKEVVDGIEYNILIADNSSDVIQYHVVCGKHKELTFVMVDFIQDFPQDEIKYICDLCRKTRIPLSYAELGSIS